MNSNFHCPIDLNEDQNDQTFLCTLGSSLHHQASSSSSSSSSSLSYHPFLINSQQRHVEYNTANYHGDLDNLSQSLETKMLMSNGGSSCDHMMPKKETRPKLTIRKKEERSDLLFQNQTKADQSGSPPTTAVKWMPSKMRLMKKMIINKQSMDQNFQDDDHDHDMNTSSDHYDNGYGNNNGVIRVCSDCNTTKTPLWRSGPRGPKSLCNACGIRQRKARRAAMAAEATAATGPPPQLMSEKKKTPKKNKRSSDHFTQPPKAKKSKITSTADASAESGTQSKSSPASSYLSSEKFDLDDLTIILSKSSAFQQVFPQDEKEAAILLMALSYGMVHG